MDTILQILQWAIPSGGIGAAIAWIAHRSVSNAKDAKVVHDTYKQMYEDISAEMEKMRARSESLEQKINKLTNENDELRRAVNRLRNTLVEIKRCPHYANCPVRNELQNPTADTRHQDTDIDENSASAEQNGQRKPRQREHRDKSDDDTSGSRHGSSDSDDESAEHNA